MRRVLNQNATIQWEQPLDTAYQWLSITAATSRLVKDALAHGFSLAISAWRGNQSAMLLASNEFWILLKGPPMTHNEPVPQRNGAGL